MAYSKQTWQNLPNRTTPISADRLNHMEDGIYNNDSAIGEITSSYALKSESGYSIELVLDNTTYKLTAKLKDKDNNIITTSNEIDLPIESLVASVTYDSDTNELVFTLQSGAELRVPLTGIISGLENTSNKVTTLSSGSTDTQYPSAKCVYDIIGNVETLLATLDVGNGGII